MNKENHTKWYQNSNTRNIEASTKLFLKLQQNHFKISANEFNFSKKLQTRSLEQDQNNFQIRYFWKTMKIKGYGNMGNLALLNNSDNTRPVFTCSKLTKETLEQAVKYVQS